MRGWGRSARRLAGAVALALALTPARSCQAGDNREHPCSRWATLPLRGTPRRRVGLPSAVPRGSLGSGRVLASSPAPLPFLLRRGLDRPC
jgi:hypothetical protein